MWNWIKRKLDIGSHKWICAIDDRHYEDKRKLARRVSILEDIVDDLIYERGESGDE